MKPIKQIRFKEMIIMPGYQAPETKQLQISSRLTIEYSDLGITLSWNEHKLEDQGQEPNKNIICSCFVPMHMVHQIIFDNEVIAPEPIKKKPGRPSKDAN